MPNADVSLLAVLREIDDFIASEERKAVRFAHIDRYRQDEVAGMYRIRKEIDLIIAEKEREISDS